MQKWLLYVLLPLLLAPGYTSSVFAYDRPGPFYEKGKELGEALAISAWNAIGEDDCDVDKLFNFLVKKIDGIKELLVEDIESLEDYNDYGSGLIEGLTSVFERIANSCQGKWMVLGKLAGQISADLFCEVSKTIKKAAEFKKQIGSDEKSDISGNAAYTSLCQKKFDSKVNSTCGAFLQGSKSYQRNSCTYNPDDGKEEKHSRYVIMQLSAMETSQLCIAFGDSATEKLLPLPKISRYFESEYTICLTYENLEGQTDSRPRRTKEVMKKLGEIFDVAGSKVEASGQCDCQAECFKKELEKTLVEAKKEIDLVKKEEQLTGIFYNHQIKACDMSGSLDGGAIISPRNIDLVRLFNDLTEALSQSTKPTGKVYTFCCFDFDSDQLNANMGITRFSDGSEIKLNTLAKELEADIKDKREDLMVIGYADERGRDLYNLELGWYRAKRVVDSLCGVKSRSGNKLGICDGKGYDSPRIIIASCGENEPATGKSEEERRRVQIFYPAATGVGRLSCIPRIKSE